MGLNYSESQNEGISLLTLGKFEESSSIFSQLWETDESDIVNCIYIGILDLLQDDPESAEITWMSLFLGQPPEISDGISRLLSQILDKQASLFLDCETDWANQQAKIIYEKLTEIDEIFPDSYLGLGIIAMRFEQTELAIDYFTQFIKLDNNFARAYYLRGICFRQINKFDLAIDDFQQAIKLDSKCFNNYQNLGEILLENNQPEEAISLCDKLAEKYSQNS